MITANYVYLISSLPTLQFGSKPPFTFEKLLELSSRHISGEDMATLKRSSISGDYARKETEPPVLKKWRDFDTALRNELVKIRASHKRLDPNKYLRPGEAADLSIPHITLTAHRNPNILEGERMLDETRWKFLSELEFSHYFDLEFLLIYAHKLLMLERWDRIGSADKNRMLEELV